MLTSTELNEVQGLLNYLSKYLHVVKPDDFTLIAEDGEPCAKIGVGENGDYVLKAIY